MTTSIHSDDLERYLSDLAQTAPVEPTLLEMEERARTTEFPIVGRSVGRLLELQARAIGARRVLELGSGFGYSAYWFARAVGEEGSVVCTDNDKANATDAERYLTALGVWPRIEYHVSDGLNALMIQDGFFDVIYCDVDKYDYPECWRSAAERIRVGGLYIADNVLWSGRVADAAPDPEDENTQGVLEHNRLVMSDRRFQSVIAPLRDGVMIALRLS